MNWKGIVLAIAICLVMSTIATAKSEIQDAPLQKAIKQAMDNGNISRNDIEGEPEFSTKILKKNDTYTKVEYKTRVTFKNPKGAGYKNNKWPKFEIEKTPPNTNIKPGVYDQQIKDSILKEINNIKDEKERKKALEEFKKYDFESGARTYELIETLETTYPDVDTISRIYPKSYNSYDILMGSTKTVNWQYSKEEHLYTPWWLGSIHLAWARISASIDAALGLRLPTNVGLTTPDTMIIDNSYNLQTNIIGENWDASKYSSVNVQSENGNEFVARLYASLSAQGWVIVIGDLGPYYLNKNIDYGKSFKTPIGPYESFPISDLILEPDDTHLKVSVHPLWAGIGLKIDPDLGSNRITAAWNARGDATGSGVVEYNTPYTNYNFGSVTTGDYDSTTSYAKIKLSDYKYYFSVCTINLKGNLQGGVTSIAGYSYNLNIETEYMDIMTYNCDWATSGYYMGIHQGTTANSVNKDISVTSPASISVASPNGGENWIRGTINTISWSSSGSPGSYVKIELLKGGILDSVISYSTVNNGYYSWTIPSAQTLGSDYKIRVTSTTNPAYTDTSNGNFIISSPPISSTITVIYPNGGEKFVKGTTKTLRWSYTGSPGSYIKIDLLKGGYLNRVITYNTPIGSGGSGSYNWAIPSTQTLGSDYKIRITSTSNSAMRDISDNSFIIVNPYITVISPNGGESWKRGATKTITWSKDGNVGNYVKIDLYKGGMFKKTIVSSTPNDGSHPWYIPTTQTLGSDYKIKITSTSNSAYYDWSNNNFRIY